MSQYEEDQCNEVEALESIYPDELTVISSKPHCFRILVSSQCTLEDGETASCLLQFTYPSEYPEVAPLVEISEHVNVDEDERDDGEHVGEIRQLMATEAENNLGTVMVFSIVAAVQEQLNYIVEERVRITIEERERIETERLEAEKKRLEGTTVTIESFLAWKSKFDAEMEKLHRFQGEKLSKGNERLSGQELFMKDHTLDDSDLKFLEKDADTVEVDESLFQDMDDLDLDEDDLDELS